MTKDAVADWDDAESGNTEIAGISIAEGATPAPNLNNAIREMMAQIKTWTGVSFVRASNANGVYFRFTGGFQVCFHQIDDSAQGWTTLSGGEYHRDGSALPWTFPAAFDVSLITPVVIGIPLINSNRANGCSLLAVSGTSANVLPYTSVSTAGGTTKFVLLVALGMHGA